MSTPPLRVATINHGKIPSRFTLGSQNLLGFFIEPRVGGYLQGGWALLSQLPVPGRIYQTDSYSPVAWVEPQL